MFTEHPTNIFAHQDKVAREFFIFPRPVLQILFQLQFGLSFQCEIYHRHKWNVRIITSYFFQKTCYRGNDITHSVAPPKSKAIVLLREWVGEIFPNSYTYMLLASWEVRIGKNCDRGHENAARGRPYGPTLSPPITCLSSFFFLRWTGLQVGLFTQLCHWIGLRAV